MPLLNPARLIGKDQDAALFVDKLFGFFVGQVMKASKGKANPDLVNQLLKKKLSE